MISVNIALLFPETIWSALSANISTDPATTTFATVSSSIVFSMATATANGPAASPSSSSDVVAFAASVLDTALSVVSNNAV